MSAINNASVSAPATPEQRRQYKHYSEIRQRLMFSLPLAVPPPPLVKKVTIEPLVEVEKPQVVPLDMLAPPSIHFLIKVAALRHGVTVRQLKSKQRLSNIVVARHDAMCLVFQHTQLSLPATGRQFGRDHTTILHALRKAGKNFKLVELRPWIKAESRKAEPGSVQHYAGLARTAHSLKVRERIARSIAEGKTPERIAQDIGFKLTTVLGIVKQLEKEAPRG